MNTFAEIDLSALSHNLSVVKKRTKNKPILAVVKANAYGHGATRVARHLVKGGISMLGVAFMDEAIELREAGIKAPIVVFFERGRIREYFTYSLTPVIYDLESACAFSVCARKQNCAIPVHIKTDTGMGRIGLRFENALSDILKIAELKNLRLEGLMSHLCDADMTDKDFSSLQVKRFSGLIRALKQKNVHFIFYHLANSAAVLQLPKAHFNMVRPGIMLYGYGPAQESTLRPVLSLKSRIILIKKVPAGTPVSYARTFFTKKKSSIATIPIGYADGFSRRLSNSGEVLINHARAPVVGRVCMDTIMVDVTGIPDAKVDSEVVLIGRQGKAEITARDIADRIGTIPYEVLATIGNRVRRIYT